VRHDWVSSEGAAADEASRADERVTPRQAGGRRRHRYAAAGLDVAEVCAPGLADLAPRDDDGGQITEFGKGGKIRVVLLPASVWRALVQLRGEAGPDDPVFRSAKAVTWIRERLIA
jgi:integrase